MRFKPQPRHLLIALCAALVLTLAAFGQYHRLFERAWFNVAHAFGPAREQTLGLADYRAVIQHQPIEGLPADVSALTFDPERRSLFTVTNKNAELVELSLDGVILRRIRLVGFGDPEGVAYVSPGAFVISDESKQRLLAVHIDAHTLTLDAADAEQTLLDIGGRRNRGLEGLAYDHTHQRLFVANEQSPATIYEVSGFPRGDDASQPVTITRSLTRDGGLFVRDLSSLHVDQRFGHLLALSDQSRLLLELDTNRQPISALSLRKGPSGLRETIPQAEGVAMDDQGNIYMVSEPNLFYVFKKPTPER